MLCAIRQEFNALHRVEGTRFERPAVCQVQEVPCRDPFQLGPAGHPNQGVVLSVTCLEIWLCFLWTLRSIGARRIQRILACFRPWILAIMFCRSCAVDGCPQRAVCWLGLEVRVRAGVVADR